MRNRYYQGEFFSIGNFPQETHDVPDKIRRYGIELGGKLKTPSKLDLIYRKRNSSFNENTRRPINTLTAPKKGDNSDSISPIVSDDEEIDFKRYTKKQKFNKLFRDTRLRKSFTSVK